MTDRQEKSIAEARYAVVKEAIWLAAGTAATVWVVLDPVGDTHQAAAVGLAGIALGYLVCSFAEAVLVHRKARSQVARSQDAAGEDGGGCGAVPSCPDTVPCSDPAACPTHGTAPRGCDWHEEGGYGFIRHCSRCRETTPDPSLWARRWVSGLHKPGPY